MDDGTLEAVPLIIQPDHRRGAEQPLAVQRCERYLEFEPGTWGHREGWRVEAEIGGGGDPKMLQRQVGDLHRRFSHSRRRPWRCGIAVFVMGRTASGFAVGEGTEHHVVRAGTPALRIHPQAEIGEPRPWRLTWVSRPRTPTAVRTTLIRVRGNRYCATR